MEKAVLPPDQPEVPGRADPLADLVMDSLYVCVGKNEEGPLRIRVASHRLCILDTRFTAGSASMRVPALPIISCPATEVRVVCV